MHPRQPPPARPGPGPDRPQPVPRQPGQAQGPGGDPPAPGGQAEALLAEAAQVRATVLHQFNADKQKTKSDAQYRDIDTVRRD